MGLRDFVQRTPGVRTLVYGTYGRRVEAHLDPDQVPRHVGVMLDGNRRWARQAGMSTVDGHRRGADKIQELLGWCEETGVGVVTLWLLSTDNLNRPQEELVPLLGIIEDAVRGLADAAPRWKVNPVGALDLLPEQTATVLKEAGQRTADSPGIVVNVAVCYGGRYEIVDAVRALLQEQSARGGSLDELAESLRMEDIARHLYTSGQPDPDLIIRTSGEQRLSGFLLWQSAHSEFYFCEVFWPAFRKVDFLRALRDYANRHRRYGA